MPSLGLGDSLELPRGSFRLSQFYRRAQRLPPMPEPNPEM
jgi:hypothetical protein